MGKLIPVNFGTRGSAPHTPPLSPSPVEAALQALDRRPTNDQEATDMELSGLVANFQMLKDDLNDPSVTALTEETRQDIFKDIYGLTHRQVAGVIARLCGYDTEIIHDVVQETYRRAYKGLDDFRGESKINTWLCQIAINRAITIKQHRERIHRIREHATDLLTKALDRQPDPNSSREMDDVETRYDLSGPLRAALSELPSNQRHVVVLRAIEGLSHKKIAEILGINEDAVKVRYFRGLQRLHKLIGSNPSKQLTTD